MFSSTRLQFILTEAQNLFYLIFRYINVRAIQVLLYITRYRGLYASLKSSGIGGTYISYNQFRCWVIYISRIIMHSKLDHKSQDSMLWLAFRLVLLISLILCIQNFANKYMNPLFRVLAYISFYGLLWTTQSFMVFK